MYGNNRVPGIRAGEEWRYHGGLWRGAPESTWFKYVMVNGDGAEATPIPLGTVLKETADGSYLPMEEADILTGTAGLPGARLAIVADTTGKTPTTETVEGENGPESVKKASSILVGIMGEVDQDRLIVSGKKWGELTDEQRQGLRTQLESWNFNLVYVMQG